jgi:hypothetical protein
VFDTFGGKFGIDRALVSSIERSERSVSAEPAANIQPEKRVATQEDVGRELTTNPAMPSNSIRPEVADKEPAPPKGKKELKKDEAVLKQYGELQGRFGQLNDLPKHEVHALDADINSFRAKLETSDLSEAHKDEIEALKTLQKAIAAYLRVAYR